MLQIMQ
jgi:hypothetical protein